MACTSPSALACRFNPTHPALRNATTAADDVLCPACPPKWRRISRLMNAAVLFALSLVTPVDAASAGAEPWVQYGIASWYGVPFHGRLTANGERYDMFNISAAHQHAPLGIHAIVTHLQTGRIIRVRINDRGPFIKGRVLDLSYGAASHLGMVEEGLAPVRIEFLPGTQPLITFVVQAGAYQDPASAKQVQHTLKSHYPDVRVTPQLHGGQQFYRVRLGPFATRSAADQIRRQLKSFGYHALILPQP